MSCIIQSLLTCILQTTLHQVQTYHGLPSLVGTVCVVASHWLPQFTGVSAAVNRRQEEQQEAVLAAGEAGGRRLDINLSVGRCQRQWDSMAES